MRDIQETSIDMKSAISCNPVGYTYRFYHPKPQSIFASSVLLYIRNKPRVSLTILDKRRQWRWRTIKYYIPVLKRTVRNYNVSHYSVIEEGYSAVYESWIIYLLLFLPIKCYFKVVRFSLRNYSSLTTS